MKNRLPLLFALATVCAIPAFVSAQTYNVYFGDIHSHSWYSDGHQDQDTNTYKKPVARAITYARDVANDMDFLGVSDHNHNESLHMKLGYWRAGFLEADSMTQNGVFVGLFGAEWGTISTGGHVLIYGTEKLFGWNPGLYDVFVAKGDYGALFDSVKKYNGYCYLAHPNSSDFDGIFTGAYNASWDSVVEGVSLKSGPASSTNTTESDPSSGLDIDRYHDLLKKGYHVGPVANQDNHNTNFGMANQQRTAVLATSLTKANIDDAFRKRRVYASEDHNLKVYFEVGSHQMGEIFTNGTTVNFRVKVVDPGETVSRIEIRYGVPGSGSAPTTLSTVLNQDSLILAHSQTAGTTYYYYAYVQQTGTTSQNEAWTAPMWITATSTPPPGAFALQTPANAATGVALNGSLTWDASANATGYDVYLGTSNPPTTMVSSNQASTSYNYSGLTSGIQYYWKVIARNSTSTLEATGSPRNFTTVVITPGAFALLTPTDGQTNRPLSGNLTWEASANALVYDVYFGASDPPNTIVSANQAGTSYAYGGLANNTQYFWKVIAKNGAQSTTATGSPWDFTTVLNAPGSFAQLSPANGSLHQPVSGSLSWQTSTNATGYDVYFGTSNPPPLVSSNQPGTTYSYGPLPENTLSYWKIVARNATDTTIATGSPWNFTTVNPPGPFVLVSPDSGSIERPLTGTLSWDPSANATGYDVFVDVNDPPLVKVDSNLAGTNYFYDNFQPSTTYFWKVIAKNVDGEITSANAPWHFTTVNVPMAPLDLAFSDNAMTSLSLHWKDTASNEDGYRIYRSLLADGPFDLIADIAANSIIFSDTGLNINARYYYRVIPYNGSGEGLAGEINVNTLADVPGMPLLTLINDLFIHLEIDPESNPAYTKFAVKIEYDTVVAYVQQNGTVSGSPDWRTFDEWGGASGVTLSGLSCTDYAVSVQARNEDGIVTAFSASANQSLECTSVANDVQTGWNLVSLPVQVADSRKSIVFPTSASQAFSYFGSYQQKDTLINGIGYWVKFNDAETVNLNGQTLTEDSIQVISGWNIIGSISLPVATTAIVEEPSGLVSSSFFGYNGAYAVTDSIRPMQAYWVKANQAGTLILSSSLQNQPKAFNHFIVKEDASQYGNLRFDDGNGHIVVLALSPKPLTESQQIAAELPPAPPQGTFDIRFGSQTSIENLNVSGPVDIPVHVQSSRYPVRFSWDLSSIKGTSLTVEIGQDNIALAATGSVLIPEGVKRIRLTGEKSATRGVPGNFALHQNYPNPFNPSTEIRYELPVKSEVRLRVYNLLGVEVATLVEGEMEPGYHSVTWTPDLSSGLYFYKIEAISLENQAVTFQKIERMILLK